MAAVLPSPRCTEGVRARATPLWSTGSCSRRSAWGLERRRPSATLSSAFFGIGRTSRGSFAPSKTTASAFSAMVPRLKAMSSCSSAASARISSKPSPRSTKTSSARSRRGRTFRSFPSQRHARCSPITSWCSPGISRTALSRASSNSSPTAASSSFRSPRLKSFEGPMITGPTVFGMARKLVGNIFPQSKPGLEASTAPRNSAAIYKHLLGRNLVVLDVGCRWGFADFWQQLSPYIVLYGFDPDPVECERLRASYKDPNVHLVPLALADEPGERTLYLTREMACSSLYRPDPSLTASLPELACASEVGTSKIRVTTLDEWSAANGVSGIDFIKLDTQGAELDVLRGGGRALDSVRALEVEVEFNPIYMGQPLIVDF